MADIRINSLPTTASASSSDDFLALDGATNGTRKLNAFSPTFGGNLTVTDVILGTSGPSAKSSIAARAPRQGLVFDGTAGATYSNITLGSGDFTVAVWARVPTTSAANRQLLGSSGGDTALFLDTTGLAKIYISGQSTYTASSVVPDQKSVLIVYTKSGSSGTFYQNAVSNGAVTDSNNYSTAWSHFGARSGGGYTTGTLIPLIYNRALSASEVVALYEAGAPSGADYNSASNTAINTSTAVDGVAGNNTFAATAGGSFTGASATGFTAVSGGGAYAAASFQPNFTVQPGQIIRVTYTATVNSGTVVASLMNSSVSSISASHTVTTGTRTVEFVATAASTSARVIFGSSGGGACNFSVSSVSVVRSGLLLAPDAAQAGGGLVWYDTSGNAANITLPASGVSWNVPSSRVLGGNWTNSGNLTVSGTEASSFAGRLSISSTTGIGLQTALAVSSSSALGVFTDYTKTSGTSRTWSLGATGTSSAAGDNAFGLYDGTAAAFRLLVASTGNFLIGTTIDGGNGKLQLATHLTSAGGIGFGADLSLYRANTGFLILNDASAALDCRIGLYNQGTQRGLFEAYNVGSAVYMGAASAGWGTIITSGNQATALTLDSSQNATFAGNVAIQSGKALRLYNPANSSFASIEMDSNNVVNVNYTTAFGVTIRTQGGTASTPASASATGVAGTIQWDANYIYVCTAANTWKRVAIATWP